MRVLYNFTVLSVVLLLIGMFYIQKLWSSRALPKNIVNVVVWTDTRSIKDDMLQVRSRKVMEPMCNHSIGLFDYQFDPEGAWNYSNISCPRICTSQWVLGDCFVVDELVQNTPDGIFFTTSIRERYLSADASSLPEQGKYLHSLFPYEDAYKFRFLFHFSIPADDLSKPEDMKIVTGLSGSSAIDVLLVVLNHDGKIWKSFRPTPAGIEIAMKDLFSLAGQPHLLDIAQPDLGRNNIPNAHIPAGPVARLSGTEIESKIICYDSHTLPPKIKVEKWDSTVCTLQVSQSDSTWSARHEIRTMKDISTSRSYYGIHVAFSSEAELRVVDVPRAVDFLTTMIVLIALPSAAFRFVAIHCLGHLSKIYRSVLDEGFSISHNVASLVMNMMVASTVYQNIADSGEGISIHHMEKMLSFALSDTKELDDQEVHSLAVFVFLLTHDLHETKRGPRQSGGFTANLLGSLDEFKFGLQHNTGESIHKASFMSVMFESAKVSLDDVVRLFDLDRKRSFLESAFMPLFLKGKKKRLLGDLIATTKDDALQSNDNSRDSVLTSLPQRKQEQTEQEPERACHGNAVDFRDAELVSLQQRIQELERRCKDNTVVSMDSVLACLQQRVHKLEMKCYYPVAATSDPVLSFTQEALDSTESSQFCVPMQKGQQTLYPDFADQLFNFEDKLRELDQKFTKLASQFDALGRATTSIFECIPESASRIANKQLDSVWRGNGKEPAASHCCHDQQGLEGKQGADLEATQGVDLEATQGDDSDDAHSGDTWRTVENFFAILEANRR